MKADFEMAGGVVAERRMPSFSIVPGDMVADLHFRAFYLSIGSRTPAGKMIIGVFSSNQYERENNCERSLAGIVTLTGSSRASVKRHRYELPTQGLSSSLARY